MCMLQPLWFRLRLTLIIQGSWYAGTKWSEVCLQTGYAAAPSRADGGHTGVKKSTEATRVAGMMPGRSRPQAGMYGRKPAPATP